MVVFLLKEGLSFANSFIIRIADNVVKSVQFYNNFNSTYF